MPRYINPAKVNVGEKERLASVLGGSAMLLYALTRRKLSTLPLAASAAYILYRGVSGRDVVYDILDIDRSSNGSRRGTEVEHNLTINRPRSEVYKFWSQLENLPRFMQHLLSVEVVDPQRKRSHWVARGPLNTNIDWDAEITQDIENELIAWRSLPGSEVDHRGTIKFNDAPGGRGTEVMVHLVYNPMGGSAGATIAKLFGEEPDQQIQEDVRRYKQIMETGETATVFGQTSGRQVEVASQRDEIRRRKMKDVVQEASEESFPASDAPAWSAGSKHS